jgi:xylulose-5-phosphate/fructose-6-phosphate phosphoketolase
VVNKKAEVVRVYLPPDANTLLSVADHCLRSTLLRERDRGRQAARGAVAGHAAAAERHCTVGLGIWEWASNDNGVAPDVVMACAGDVPTLETMAAVDLLRTLLPALKVRVVNVVDLMALQSPEGHPHGLKDAVFDCIFSTDAPVIFAFHGYPALIHRLTYKRATTATSMCTATRRRARPPRPST